MRKLKNKIIWLVLLVFSFNFFVPYAGGISVKASDNMNIVSSTPITASTAKEWARSKGATETFISLADLYWKYSASCGNVNPAVAYVQAAKETGYGRFGGVLNESFHNPCGLKTSKGGDDTDPNAHMRFNNWDEGVQAHLDHLALYAGAQGYPKSKTYDPRHFPSVYGKSKTVTGLGKNWAPSPTYGNEIMALYNNLLEKQDSQKVEPQVQGPKEKITVIDAPSNNATLTNNKVTISGWALNPKGVSKINIYLDNKFVKTATMGISRPDVQAIYPAYKNANSGYSATLDLTGVSNGTKTIKVEQVGTDNSTNYSQVKINVNFIKDKPIQVIDAPENNSEVAGNSLKVSGWSLNTTPISKINIYINDKFMTTATMGISRPDVKAVYPSYNNANSGYSANLDISNISGGVKTIRVEQVANNGSTYSTETKVNIKKANPIQVIDSLKSGQVIDGNSLTVDGWSLNAIGVSKINIYVDGTLKGTTTTNIARPDVKNVYPQYNELNSGYSAKIDISNISGGNKKVRVEQVAKDGSTYNTEVGVYINKPMPLQVIDTPSNNSAISKSKFTVSGWSLNNNGIKEIKIYLDNKLKATTTTTIDRPDVKSVYPQYTNASKSGYSAEIETSDISAGNKILKVEQVALNGEVTVNQITVNIQKPSPITVIDTPLNNANVGGDTFNVSGWALNSSKVAEVKIFIDNQLMATTTTKNERRDVYNVYPQYNELKSGYSATVNLATIKGGVRTLKVEQVGIDGSVNSTSTTIRVNKNVPLTVIDNPSNGASIKSKSINVSGWALNPEGVSKIEVYVNNRYITTAKIGLSRPDVEKVYPSYKDSNSGYTAAISLNEIMPGENSITVKQIGKDGSTNSVSTTINLVKKSPVSVLDSPAGSSLVTSDSVNFSGWALNDSGVRTVNIYIDKIKVASPVINISRPDVVKVYPGYQDTNVCGFSANVNVSNLSKGAHDVTLEVIGKDGTISMVNSNFFYKEKPSKLIVLDPGHNNGGDEGAFATVDGTTYSETLLNGQIALKTKTALENQGYRVVLTRDPLVPERYGLSESLSRRARLANSLNADLFVSIHQNKFSSEAAHGTEVYYSTKNADSGYNQPANLSRKINISKQLASKISSSISNDCGFYNRGPKDGNLYVCRNTQMPSVLIECGFISNRSDVSKLSNPVMQQMIANSIANGVRSVAF